MCLEVSVTLRSVPSESGGQTQPIREEGRTVIVFDNGAVLRSANSLPAGQTLILSNPNGRDVACRISAGRSLPNLKGYVEVEFIEPVNDFWGIHESPGAPDAAKTPSMQPAAPAASQEAPKPSVILNPPAASAISVNSLPQPVAVSKPLEMPPLVGGETPEGGLKRNSPVEPPAVIPISAASKSGLPKSVSASDYSHEVQSQTDSIANWEPSIPEPRKERPQAAAASREESSASRDTSKPGHDFMSHGIMAYNQGESSDAPAAASRTPLILGVAAIVLAGVCGFLFFRRPSGTSNPASSTVASNTAPADTSAAPDPAKPSNSSETTRGSAEVSAPAAEPSPSQSRLANASAEPAAAAAPDPAVLKSPVVNAAPADAAAKRTATAPAKEPEAAAAKRPAIPNLKIAAPVAPKSNPSAATEAAPNAVEISGTGAAATPAGLLTASGRASNPPAPPVALASVAPAPPPPAPAAPSPVSASRKVDAKLISTPRLVYPPAARQSNVQGTVPVLASIDATGKVVSAKALSGPPLLRSSAEDSVRQWKYSPALADGKPVATDVTVNVDFKLTK